MLSCRTVRHIGRGLIVFEGYIESLWCYSIIPESLGPLWDADHLARHRRSVASAPS